MQAITLQPESSRPWVKQLLRINGAQQKLR
jgi:hypothetical protein